MRKNRIGSWILIGFIQSACSGGVVERVRGESPAPVPSVDAGRPAPLDAGGGGDGGDRRIPDLDGGDGVDDSGTLSVAISITAWGTKGETEDQVNVEIGVSVVEWQSGAAVADAEVLGGPIGALSPLPYDVYSVASYGGSHTGYQRTWEFSVVRGKDHLKGLVLVGPSYQTLSVVPSLGSATVNWSPSQETGVWTSACALSEPSAPFAGTCTVGNDEGSLVLASNEEGEFPASPYMVTVVRNTKAPVGLGGSGQVTVWTTVQVP